MGYGPHDAVFTAIEAGYPFSVREEDDRRAGHFLNPPFPSTQSIEDNAFHEQGHDENDGAGANDNTQEWIAS